MAATPAERDDATTIALHRGTAGSVLVLRVMGQTADWLPRGPGVLARVMAVARGPRS